MEEIGLRHFLENLDSFRVLDLQWIEYYSPKEIDFEVQCDRDYYFGDVKTPESIELEYFYVEINTYELFNEGPIGYGEISKYISENLYNDRWNWFFYLFLITVAPNLVYKEEELDHIYSLEGFLIIKGCRLLRNLDDEDYELSTVQEILLKIFYPKNKEEYIDAWKKFDESKEDLTRYGFED